MDAVRTLARLGADLDAHDVHGFSPLYVAAGECPIGVSIGALQLNSDFNGSFNLKFNRDFFQYEPQIQEGFKWEP